jgi:hypothetical protein
LLALALLGGGCDRNPARARAVKELGTADLTRLRFDAAVIYKNAFAARGPELVRVPETSWPKSFRAFSPSRVTVYQDGIALGLAQLADRESGLWIIPEGMTHDPAATPRATFHELRDGVYWYEFGQAAN